jgi:hypothetical protein
VLNLHVLLLFRMLQVEPGLRDTRLQCVFRSAALLVLLLPSDAPNTAELLPQWSQLWAAIDHCSEWDHMWVTLLCRARKYTASSPVWDSTLMATVFAKARSAINTPVGQGRPPEKRSIPYQYKVSVRVCIHQSCC